MTTEQEVLRDLKEVTLEELDEAIKAVDKQEQEEAIECLQKLPITLEIKHLGGRKEIEIVLSMLEEKDKIIDLMVERLRYYNGMQQKQEFCIDICEGKECNIKKCKERIKQYFEKELLNK